jgi:hypothetical protein
MRGRLFFLGSAWSGSFSAAHRCGSRQFIESLFLILRRANEGERVSKDEVLSFETRSLALVFSLEVLAVSGPRIRENDERKRQLLSSSLSGRTGPRFSAARRCETRESIEC